MAGFMYQGLCHTREQDAIDNYFQHIQPNFHTIGTDTIVNFFLKDSEGYWTQVNQTISNTGISINNFNISAANPVFAACEDSVGSNDLLSLTAEQGALIGGSIILVWAIAFAIRAVISTLNFNEDRNEND